MSTGSSFFPFKKLNPSHSLQDILLLLVLLFLLLL